MASLLSSLHLPKLTYLPEPRAGLIKDSEVFGGSQTWSPALPSWENLCQLVHLPPFPQVLPTDTDRKDVEGKMASMVLTSENCYED